MMMMLDGILSWHQRQMVLWHAAMVARGHTPQMYDEGLDMFAFSKGTHNGPRCSACGWECCMHCERVENIPECKKKKR